MGEGPTRRASSNLWARERERERAKGRIVGAGRDRRLNGYTSKVRSEKRQGTGL